MKTISSSALLRQFWQPTGPLQTWLSPGEQWSKAGPQLQQCSPAALLFPFLLLISFLPGWRRLRPQTVSPCRQRGLPQWRGLWSLGWEGRSPDIATSACHQVARQQEGTTWDQARAGWGAEGSGRLLVAPRWYTQLHGEFQTYCQEHKT